MSALEIKPGKYRTRGGQIVSVGLDMADPPQVIGRLNGAMMSWWSNGRASNQKETPLDLIERIEDEPKAEESARRYIVDWDWQNIVKKRGYGEEARALSEKVQRAEGNHVLSESEYGALVRAAGLPAAELAVELAKSKSYATEACRIAGDANEKLAEATKRIARLEAENESLSRQLRSRERNKEPASAGKVWRWSPSL